MSVQTESPLSVHWEEGQLLQPHQFQQLQRAAESIAAFERSANSAYPHGLLSIAWDEPKLQTHQLLITQLTLVMPNGAIVRVPENAVLPELAFKSILAKNPSGFTVYVAMPKLQPGRPNAFRVSRTGAVVADSHRRRFLVEDVELHDENQSENKVTLAGRRYNLSLITDGDAPDGFDTFPLLRIRTRERDVTATPIIDPDFVPASLHLRHALAAPIKDLLSDLLRAVGGHLEDVGKSLETGGYNRFDPTPDQLAQVIRLAALARFRTRMLDLLQAPVAHPWSVYMELLGIRAEIAAMDPVTADFSREYGRSGDELRYMHDAPFRNFRRIATDIQSWLGSGAKLPTITPLAADRFGYLVGATITPEEHRRGVYLGIATDEAQDLVVKYVMNSRQFKVGPRLAFDAAGESEGLPLEHKYQPPRGFPASREKRPVTYFQIKGASGTDALKKVVRDHLNAPWELGIFTADDLARWEVALYVPEAERAEGKR